jgi:cyclopropane fatty-acyl-phospholipid synthase-like methyltransferase
MLKSEGLKPHHRLMDYGCGAGRLAVHSIPYLVDGRYIGVDISPTMLRHAEGRVRALPPPTCRFTFIEAGTIPEIPADFVCAFSVLTHMEHEDGFRLLERARRLLPAGGKVLVSCLPLDLPNARDTFRKEAYREVRKRWRRGRNVATSRDFVVQIAELAGWRAARWYEPGPALGQATVVLV